MITTHTHNTRISFSCFKRMTEKNSWALQRERTKRISKHAFILYKQQEFLLFDYKCLLVWPNTCHTCIHVTFHIFFEFRNLEILIFLFSEAAAKLIYLVDGWFHHHHHHQQHDFYTKKFLFFYYLNVIVELFSFSLVGYKNIFVMSSIQFKWNDNDNDDKQESRVWNFFFFRSISIHLSLSIYLLWIYTF